MMKSVKKLKGEPKGGGPYWPPIRMIRDMWYGETAFTPPESYDPSTGELDITAWAHKEQNYCTALPIRRSWTGGFLVDTDFVHEGWKVESNKWVDVYREHDMGK